MQALEDDKYVRQIHGYLPAASVAFIDEIFKANSAILNTLLTILNERLFDNGTERLTVPLICLVGACCIVISGFYVKASALSQHTDPHLMPHHLVTRQVGASNELPESEELDALYDRFLVSAHHPRALECRQMLCKWCKPHCYKDIH